MRTSVFYAIAAASVGTITSFCIASYYIYQKKKLLQPPKNAKWQFVGIVEEIDVHPVTSGASIILNEVLCKTDGLYSEGVRDRSLILYDENDKSVFAGTYPIMLSITTEVRNKTTLVVRAPHMQPLDINLDLLKRKNPVMKQKPGLVHHLVEGELEHHKWFSEVVLKKSQGLKLFFNLKTEFLHNLLGEDKSDFIPVMVMNDVSINDLNLRLLTEDQAHHSQFRGNILIKSSDSVKPYDEDNWSWLRFGKEQDKTESNCILRYRAPCLRCILPNINTKTYERNQHFEPLKSLKKYRLIHNSKEPTLGAYYKVYQEGIVNLNDPVYAIVS